MDGFSRLPVIDGPFHTHAGRYINDIEFGLQVHSLGSRDNKGGINEHGSLQTIPILTGRALPLLNKHSMFIT